MTADQTPPSTASTGIFLLKTLVTLRQRADFLRAAQARRVPTPAFLLQARKRTSGETSDAPDAIRVGFTCSKKVGNAVARNRAKRRLRALAHSVLPSEGKDGWDYVLIGRKDATANHNFTALQEDLVRALRKAHP